MLGWFRPRCPLDTRTKVWTERRMSWLASRFGAERLRAARVVLPTGEFFPEPYTADEVLARAWLDRLCGHMGADPAAVTLEVLDDEQLPGAAGLYQKRERSIICVARSQLAAPPQLLATLTHELAHELLLKGGHLTGDEPDHEQVTDLLPVALGTGILVANATVQFASSSDGTTHSWSISRQGYLSSIELGYALALFAAARGEDSPPWAAHLRTDAAATLRAGLRYIRRTGDTLFSLGATAPPGNGPTPADVVSRLRHGSPTHRLSALQDVTEYRLSADGLLPAVEGCLSDADEAVQAEAAIAVGGFGTAAASSVPLLTSVLWGGPQSVRAAVAQALGRIGADPQHVVPDLARLVGDDSHLLSTTAAYALAQFGGEARAAEASLMEALYRAAEVHGLRPVGGVRVRTRSDGPGRGGARTSPLRGT